MAKILANVGGMPITEAALDSGFQSVRTFHEVYRRMKGSSPRELKGTK